MRGVAMLSFQIFIIVGRVIGHTVKTFMQLFFGLLKTIEKENASHFICLKSEA